MSNELGAGNPKKAQKAVFVTLKISMLFAIAAVLVIIFGHDIWTGFFSDSSTIKDQFASMTPLIGLSIMADSIQGVLSGWYIYPPTNYICILLIIQLMRELLVL